MTTVVTWAVCDENGELHEMPEQMARHLASVRDETGHGEWSLWRRVDEVETGKWHQPEVTW